MATSDPLDTKNTIEQLIEEGQLSWADGVRMMREEHGGSLSQYRYIGERWKALQERVSAK